MHIVDGPGGKRGRHCGEQRRLGDAEANFLALHAAHGLAEAGFRQCRIALGLGPEAKPQTHGKQNAHGEEDTAPLSSE